MLASLAILVFLGLNVKFHFLDIPAVPPKYDAQNMSLADKGMTQPLFTELGTPGHTSRIGLPKPSGCFGPMIVTYASL